MAEPIGDIRIGAYYYKKGFFDDPRVEVVSVDVRRNKVKIYDPSRNEIYEISPTNLVDRSESFRRDVDRTLTVLSVLGALLDSSTTEKKSVENKKPIYKSETLNVDKLGLSGILEKRKIAEKNSDQAKLYWPSAPNTNGQILGVNDLDIWCKAPIECRIYHDKSLDYQSISHILYHADEQWLAIVMRDGRRYSIGMHIKGDIRPFWKLYASLQVQFARTADDKNGDRVTVENRWFPAFVLYGDNSKATGRYSLGLSGRSIGNFNFSGRAYPGGVKLISDSTNLFKNAPLLEPNDIIIGVDGVPILGIGDYIKQFNHLGYQGDKTVTLNVLRGQDDALEINHKTQI